jgi:hypothetical protein
MSAEILLWIRYIVFELNMNLFNAKVSVNPMDEFSLGLSTFNAFGANKRRQLSDSELI